jgi:hypothetical protein
MSYLRLDARFLIVIFGDDKKSVKFSLWNGLAFEKEFQSWKPGEKLNSGALRKSKLSLGGQTLSVAVFHVFYLLFICAD